MPHYIVTDRWGRHVQEPPEDLYTIDEMRAHVAWLSRVIPDHAPHGLRIRHGQECAHCATHPEGHVL